MNQLKHFTLLETDPDSEAPMIGTIDNVVNDRFGQISFEARFRLALQEHFDVEDIEYDKIPELFAGSPYDDMEVKIDNQTYTVRIIETWIY